MANAGLHETINLIKTHFILSLLLRLLGTQFVQTSTGVIHLHTTPPVAHKSN